MKKLLPLALAFTLTSCGTISPEIRTAARIGSALLGVVGGLPQETEDVPSDPPIPAPEGMPPMVSFFGDGGKTPIARRAPRSDFMGWYGVTWSGRLPDGRSAQWRFYGELSDYFYTADGMNANGGRWYWSHNRKGWLWTKPDRWPGAGFANAETKGWIADVTDPDSKPVSTDAPKPKVSDGEYGLCQPWGPFSSPAPERTKVTWGIAWDYRMSWSNGSLSPSRSSDLARADQFFPNGEVFLEVRHHSAPGNVYPASVYKGSFDDWGLGELNSNHPEFQPRLLQMARAVADSGAHLYFDWGFQGNAGALTAAANEFRRLRPDGVVLMNVNDFNQGWFLDVADAVDIEDGRWDLNHAYHHDQAFLNKYDRIIRDWQRRVRRPDLSVFRIRTSRQDVADALYERWGGQINFAAIDTNAGNATTIAPRN
jgi:hypothetical protein